MESKQRVKEYSERPSLLDCKAERIQRDRREKKKKKKKKKGKKKAALHSSLIPI